MKKILIIKTVTTVFEESLFSTSRRLKTYLRSASSKSRLNELSITYIHEIIRKHFSNSKRDQIN